MQIRMHGSHDGVGHPETQEQLIQELLDIWDGGREHGHSLAKLKQAVATLQVRGVNRLGRTR